MDDFTRRGFLIAGLGLLVGGCAEKVREPSFPRESTSGRTLGRYPSRIPASLPPEVSPRPEPSTGPPNLISRSEWSIIGPMFSRMNPMNGISAITVHHAAMLVSATSPSKSEVINDLRRIQRDHIKRMTAGDIGYHFIVDRAGRVWEGRSLGLQGAHVKDKNPHNIGVMLLGDFELQFPSEQQKASLKQLLSWLMKRYSVPAASLHTHRELGPTACPGRYLQPHVEAFRSRP